MRTLSTRAAARLGCEALEDRTTPTVSFALSGTNLLGFDIASPGVVTTTAVTGVTAGETLVGIDFRPQNGLLYGLGVNGTANTGTLYAISTRTGFAAVVGAAPSTVAFTTDGTTPVDLPDPATAGYGFDFNPAADRVRVTTSTGLTFRVNPNTGAGVDGDNGGAANSVTGTNPDGPITGGTTSVDAAAYTNNQPNNGGITTLYTLDAATNALYIQNPPNAGAQVLVTPVTLGGAALDFTAASGFDIPAGVNAGASNAPVTSGTAFAVLNVGGATGLYGINLVNGQATFVGAVGTGTAAVQGFAVQSDLGGFPAVGLSADGTTLIRFNTGAPGTTTTQALATGSLVAGETLVGIDFRPQTGQLYALGVNPADTGAGANTGTLYLVDPQTGALTVVGTPSQITFTTDGVTVVDLPDPAAAGYGLDFNPSVDRLRVTTGTGLNFRVIPSSGAPVDGNNGGAVATGTNPDGNINGSGVTGVIATAYTNSSGRDLSVTGPTTQYTLDATTNALYIQNAPNAGTQTVPRPLTLSGAPLDFTSVGEFDIPAGVTVSASNAAAAGFGYAVLTVGATAGLYRIDLATGAATNLGPVGAGTTQLAGLALADAPAGAVAFTSATAAVGEGGGAVTINLTRTGGTSGALVVLVNVTGGTATAGADFTAGPYAVVFADGATTASFSIPVADDTLVESAETIALNIASVSNAGVFGAQRTATVTITDNDVPPTPPPGVTPVAIAAGSGVGGGAVNLYSATGALIRTLTPYAGYGGGVSVAVGDVTGDGVADVITGTATGATHVKVFDGATGAEVRSFFAYAGATVGVSVGVGNLTGDGFADVITGAGANGHVKAFDGQTGAEIRSFLAYAGFAGSVGVAGGDIDGDGRDDIITGAGTGASGHVKAFSGTTGAELRSFLAYSGFNGGVSVGAGDIDGDGRDDLITGATVNGHVKVFNGRTNAELRSFLAYGGFPGAVDVAGGDVNGDGRDDIITGAGPGAAGGAVKAFSGQTNAELRSFLALGATFTGGVFVG